MNEKKRSPMDVIKDRVTAIEKALSETNKGIKNELNSVRRILGEHRDTLMLTDAHVVRDRLRAMSGRMLEMERRQQAMVLRFTVATELVFLARHSRNPAAMSIAPIIIHAFDNSDAWWHERSDLLLGEWEKELRNWHDAGAVIVSDAKGEAA